MIIGIDDTDSKEGMCTTYLGALLLKELEEYATIEERPILVRLNPTIPYKTRGNAAVGIRLETDQPEKVMEHVISRIEEMAQMEGENTNPGVVFIPDKDCERTKKPLGEFFGRAVRDVISIQEAKELIHHLGIPSRGFKNGRGLIGSLAACGAMLNDGWDHTYEYLTYRQREVWGTSRSVDEESVRKADMATYPLTWDTVDVANDLVVCVPHGPDPVLYGIRGDSPQEAVRTAEIIHSEPIECCALYRTNQGTDMHLIPAARIADIEDMHSYIIQAKVVEEPRTIQGGHVIFSICDEEGMSMDCAAYEPTKNFRELIRKLIADDELILCGSVKNNTLNIEKIEVVSLAQKQRIQNPECPSCGKRMKSAGKEQGYRCKKCGTKAESPMAEAIQRNIETGVYEVPPCARRHLAKPLVRGLDTQRQLFPSR